MPVVYSLPGGRRFWPLMLSVRRKATSSRRTTSEKRSDMLESCPHCSARVLFTSDYCPGCHRSRTDGSLEAGFVAALPSDPLAPSTSRKLHLLPFWLAVLLMALGCVVSYPLVARLGCFLLAAVVAACALFLPKRGYRITASLLVIVALVSAYMAYRYHGLLL